MKSLIVCLGLIALLAVPALGDVNSAISGGRCIQQCSQNDFLAANAVATIFAYAVNQSTINSTYTVEAITQQFSEFNCVYDGSGYLGVGPVHSINSATYTRATIAAGFSWYYQGLTGEFNAAAIPRSWTWDCVARTLIVEWDWQATLWPTLARDLVFTVNASGVAVPAVTLPAGKGYTSNHIELFSFDSTYQVIQWREYLDPAQFLSTRYTNYDVNSGSISPSCAIPKCSNADRARAVQVAESLVYALNLIPINANAAANSFSKLFAAAGVWSTGLNPTVYPYTPAEIPQANFVGPVEIAAQFLIQAASEAEQSTNLRATYWDCNSRSLAMARGRQATLLAPRAFGATALPIGTTYTNDAFDLIRFNTNFEIVSYRSYADSYQYESIYPTLIAPVASNRCLLADGCEIVLPAH